MRTLVTLLLALCFFIHGATATAVAVGDPCVSMETCLAGSLDVDGDAAAGAESEVEATADVFVRPMHQATPLPAHFVSCAWGMRGPPFLAADCPPPTEPPRPFL